MCDPRDLHVLTHSDPTPRSSVLTPLLVVPGLGIAIYYVVVGDWVGFGAAPGISWLLVSAGAVTAVPLLLFATAARRMSYAALGFCQYLTPSLVFLLGLFLYKEPLRPVQLVCFLLIWISIAVFSFDIRSEEHTSELQSLMRISYA